MANRKRPIVLRCPVTAEERALIEQKMAQLPSRSLSNCTFCERTSYSMFSKINAR